MSSELESTVTSLLQNNYSTVAIIVAIGYDYILTLPNEIEQVWNKPWTWVSTMFILVRYVGLFNVMSTCLLGSTFIPGPVKVRRIVYKYSSWTFIPFITAADLVMALRVWAMYGRSRPILGALLVLLSLELVFTIFTIANTNPRNQFITTFQVLDFSVCVWSFSSVTWEIVAMAFQIAIGAVMCVLATAQSVRQSLQMYSLTKHWHLNQYMTLLMKQGILYFFAVLLSRLINFLFVLNKGPTEGWQVILVFILEFVPMYTLTPRFILSIRVMYARDVQGRRGEEIDSGFGLSSYLPDSRRATRVTVMFGGAERSEEWDSDVEMEARTSRFD